jgi:hypothetical protein
VYFGRISLLQLVRIEIGLPWTIAAESAHLGRHRGVSDRGRKCFGWDRGLGWQRVKKEFTR